MKQETLNPPVVIEAMEEKEVEEDEDEGKQELIEYDETQNDHVTRYFQILLALVSDRKIAEQLKTDFNLEFWKDHRFGSFDFIQVEIFQNQNRSNPPFHLLSNL
jgi:hypothetical protein